MSAARRILRAEQRVVPWKNGLGTTREVASSPDGAGAGDPFVWRVSVASVERSCPFSSFPGLDRTILLVSGEGFALDFGGAAPARTLDRPLEPCAFAGEWTTTCRLLGGPVEDLNVMVDRARAAAAVDVVRASGDHPVRGDAVVGLATGRARVTLGGAVVVLDAGDALRATALPPAATLRIDLDRDAALVVASFARR